VNSPGQAALVSGLSLTPCERGILWPVVYASIFKAPVRVAHLWSRIVGFGASEEEMRAALSGTALRSLLVECEGLIWLRGLDTGAERRAFAARERATADLLSRNQELLRFVKGLRHVHFAGLSGGCAHDAADDGDIDVFLVTRENAVWRTLLWTTLVAKARGWRRILCLNYLVDTTAQTLPSTDFYAGFELTTLKSLKGEAAFRDLLSANQWAAPMFPNFFRSRLRGQNPVNTNFTTSGRHLLEATARMIHRPYLRHRLPHGPGVELSDHVVRLHATDHRARLQGLFQDALRNIGMEAPPWI
jgi:hypothetical protein